MTTSTRLDLMILVAASLLLSFFLLSCRATPHRPCHSLHLLFAPVSISVLWPKMLNGTAISLNFIPLRAVRHAKLETISVPCRKMMTVAWPALAQAVNVFSHVPSLCQAPNPSFHGHLFWAKIKICHKMSI